MCVCVCKLCVRSSKKKDAKNFRVRGIFRFIYLLFLLYVCVSSKVETLKPFMPTIITDKWNCNIGLFGVHI